MAGMNKNKTWGKKFVRVRGRAYTRRQECLSWSLENAAGVGLARIDGNVLMFHTT